MYVSRTSSNQVSVLIKPFLLQGTGACAGRSKDVAWAARRERCGVRTLEGDRCRLLFVTRMKDLRTHAPVTRPALVSNTYTLVSHLSYLRLHAIYLFSTCRISSYTIFIPLYYLLCFLYLCLALLFRCTPAQVNSTSITFSYLVSDTRSTFFITWFDY